MTFDELKGHLRQIWPDRSMDLFSWELGPINEVLPDFLVCRIAPLTPQEPWVYVTIGASKIHIGESYSIEFVLLAPDDNARHIETLAIVAYYQATRKDKLNVGRVVNCGRPWLGNSTCEQWWQGPTLSGIGRCQKPCSERCGRTGSGRGC